MSKKKETQKTFKLEYPESLRVRKRGNFYYAYARYTEFAGQKERYLGRCNPDGTIYVHNVPYSRYRR